MTRRKIGYAVQGYQSYSRTGAAYKRILQDTYTVVGEITSAEELQHINPVILHFEPSYLPAIYAKYPQLKDKYVISYCVWEASLLPTHYARSLELVQEIWTASSYCKSVFDNYHNQVVVVPHVVERDKSYSPMDVDTVKKALRLEESDFYFLAVASFKDKRKNLGDLIAAFRLCSGEIPAVRLIIKAAPNDVDPEIGDKQITVVRRKFTDQEINVLYNLCGAYVSSHHSEGWGLTLSDAMLFHKPVIATNYSGNLEFMNHLNSWLIETEEKTINPQDYFYLFGGDMRWGYPSVDNLAQHLVDVYSNRGSVNVKAKTMQAAIDMRAYRREPVGTLIRDRLGKLNY